jgi:hypothetical protein
MLSTEKTKSCRELAWEFALTSRMNVLYYQRRVANLKRWDMALRIVGMVAASATVVEFLRTHQVFGTDWAKALALLSAVSGIVGIAGQIPERARALGVLLSEYLAHEHAFQGLFQFGCTDQEVAAAIKKFGETEQREAKDDPRPNSKLLSESQATVLKEIGAPP